MFTYPFAKNTFQHFLRLIKQIMTATNAVGMQSIDAEIKSLDRPLDEALNHFDPRSDLPIEEKASAAQTELFTCECNLLELLKLIYDYRILSDVSLNPAGEVITHEAYEKNRKALAKLFDNPPAHPLANALHRYAALVAEALHITSPEMDHKKTREVIESGAMVPTILSSFQHNPSRAKIKVANVPEGLLPDLFSGSIYGRDASKKEKTELELISFELIEICIKNLLNLRNELFILLGSGMPVGEFGQSLLQQSRSDCVAKIDGILPLLNLTLKETYQKQHKHYYSNQKFNSELSTQKIVDLTKRTPIISGHVTLSTQIVLANDLLWRYFSVAEAMTQAWLLLPDGQSEKEKIRLAAIMLLENIDFDTYSILLRLSSSLWKVNNGNKEIYKKPNNLRYLYHIAESYLAILRKNDEGYGRVPTMEQIVAEDIDFTIFNKTPIFSGISTLYHSILKYQFKLTKTDPVKRAAAFKNVLFAIVYLSNHRKKMKETWHVLLHDIHAKQLIVDMYITGLYYCRTSEELALFQAEAILSEVRDLFKDDSRVLSLLLTEIRKNSALQGLPATKVDFTQLPSDVLVKCFHMFKNHLDYNQNEDHFLFHSENNYRFNTRIGGFYYRTILTISKYLSEQGGEVLRAEAKNVTAKLIAYTQHCMRASMKLADQLRFENTEYRPPRFDSPEEMEKKQRDRAASFVKESVRVAIAPRGAKKNKKGSKNTGHHISVYEPRVDDDFEKIKQYFAGNGIKLFDFYRNALSSRKVEHHSYALLGCARSLSLLPEERIKNCVDFVELNSARVLKQAKKSMLDEKYRVFDNEFNQMMRKWRKKPEIHAAVVQIVKEVVQFIPLQPAPQPIEHKASKAPVQQTKDRFFNRPVVKLQAVKPVEHAPIAHRPVAILQRQDIYASIRKKISRTIVPIPIQKSVMQFLRFHQTDPVIHGGRVFYALLGIDDNKRGDLDVLCHVKSRAELRSLLEKNKEHFAISDFRETKKLKTEILVIIFNHAVVHDQVRNQSDYQLEIACIPDTGNRLAALVEHCGKFGIYCPVYDPFTATLLDTSNQVEEMLTNYILPFQPIAGDPSVYLRENPERILDIFKRKAHCESHHVALNIEQYAKPIEGARLYLNRPVVKFSMEKFNRLFHQGYARIIFDLLKQHDCIKPLFANLGNKFYDFFALSCQLHDMEIKSLDLNTISTTAYDDLKAKFLANLFLGSFLASYNVSDQRQFYIDCVDFLSTFSFDLNFDAVLFQKVQDIWWEALAGNPIEQPGYHARRGAPGY